MSLPSSLYHHLDTWAKQKSPGIEIWPGRKNRKKKTVTEFTYIKSYKDVVCFSKQEVFCIVSQKTSPVFASCGAKEARNPWCKWSSDAWKVAFKILHQKCHSTWVCLKIVYPIVPNGFADHYPYSMAIIGGIPLFQTYPHDNGGGCSHFFAAQVVDH